MLEWVPVGLTIGLAGSLHCIGMCGPLAISMPWSSGGNYFLKTIIYHLGRTATYVLLGLGFGLIGNAFYIAGYQQWLSVLAGIIVLYIAIKKIFPGKLPDLNIPGSTKLTKAITGIISNKVIVNNPFLFGMANGLLPCGLIYLAVAAAISTGHVGSSAIVMASFGLGTMPIFTVFLLGINKISLSFRNKVNSFMPYMVMLTAFLLILRGMNLGIPYVSPKLNVEGTTPKVIHCD